VGWGLGGGAALALAERHPGLYAGLALVDSTAGGPSAQRPTKAVARVLGSPLSTMAQLSRLAFPPDQSAEAAAWLARLALVPPDDVIASAVIAQARAQQDFFADPTIARSLGNINVPTLVITGSDDTVVPPSNSLFLARKIRGARLESLAGAGYAASSQDEPEFVEAIDTFAEKTFSSTTTTSTTVAP
jgi:pimeloyl-ACP methyl ester carboxylesterase